jgi:GntR family transcriptional repressor for pyruvate dehydrogenase complex
LAARRATAEDLVHLQARAVELEKQIAAGRIYSRSNVQFHLAIARASHNNVLRESLGYLLGQLREFRERTVREIPQMSERDVVEHRAIVEAIRRRRPAAARRAAVEHIRRYAAMVKELGNHPGDGQRSRAAVDSGLATSPHTPVIGPGSVSRDLPTSRSEERSEPIIPDRERKGAS